MLPAAFPAAAINVNQAKSRQIKVYQAKSSQTFFSYEPHSAKPPASERELPALPRRLVAPKLPGKGGSSSEGRWCRFQLSVFSVSAFSLLLLSDVP
jgi:hypothetical protein